LKKDKMNVPDNEDEDNEQVSFKRWQQPAIHCTFPSSFPPSHYRRRITRRIVFRDHYCYTSSSRYLLFRVFRI
jgi:hypothetical protein